MVAAINLGIDLGSSSCRAAFYDGTSIIAVPTNPELFRDWCPIVEVQRQEAHPPRIAFPTLKQRFGQRLRVGASGGTRSAASDLLSELLGNLRTAANEFARTEFGGAVISHPLGMSRSDRAVLSAAATKAGFTRVRLVSDVRAALQAYRFHEKSDSPETLLVYSEGYMGADVVVARSSPRGIHVMAAEADTQLLGGSLIDEALVDGFLDALWQADLNIDRDALRGWLFGMMNVFSGPTIDEDLLAAWTFLHATMGQAKELIGEAVRHRFALPPKALPPGVQWLEAELDGLGLAAIMRQHNRLALELTERVLENHDLTSADIQRVLLVGGTTYQPTVIRTFAQRFGAERVLSQPILTVAEGTALVAHELGADKQAAETLPPARAAAEPTTNPYHLPGGLFFIAEARSSAVQNPRIGPAKPARPLQPNAGLATPVAAGPLAENLTVEATPVDELRLRDIRKWLLQGKQEEALNALERLLAEATRLLQHYRGSSSG